MTEPNSTDQPSSQAAIDHPARRSKLKLAANLLTQLFLIAILAVIIFIMWLPAIVSKK